MIVGCGPPNPSRGPISRLPSSSRSSTTKSRTSHQNRASVSGSRQPSTSSLIRHAIDETYSQRGNCRGGRVRSCWAPRSGNTLETVPGKASRREGILGPDRHDHTSLYTHNEQTHVSKKDVRPSPVVRIAEPGAANGNPQSRGFRGARPPGLARRRDLWRNRPKADEHSWPVAATPAPCR